MKSDSRIIFGIDPGTARMGYGIIRQQNSYTECLEYGVIETDSKKKKHERLREIYNKLTLLLSKHSPDAVGVEDIFYFKNQKTLVEVSQARGVALLAASQATESCYSFTPLQVKQAVAGYGKAEKKQVQFMVQKLLKLEDIPKPDDAADALAVALCCAASLELLQFEGR